MSYLNCIKPFQRVDLSNHLPFFIGDERVGWVQKPFIEHLKQFSHIFICDDKRVTLYETLDNFDNRSAAIKNALSQLADQGIVKHNPFGPHNPISAFQNDEKIPIGSQPFTTPLAKISRYYKKCFGILHHSVNLIGYNEKGIWVAKRSENVDFPRKLDHIASGYCAINEDVKKTLTTEAYEEAGLSKGMYEAQFVGKVEISYNTESDDIFRDSVHVFKVKLPENINLQTNQPDEVSGFQFISFDEVNDQILNHDIFAYTPKIILIYFLIKYGYVSENHEEYSDLINAFNYNPEDDLPAY